MRNVSFVRSEMLAEQTPPLTSIGVIGWARENLFNGWFNSILNRHIIILSLFFSKFPYSVGINADMESNEFKRMSRDKHSSNWAS